ncbi:MAG: orotidine-5'-phosphate decarboxylase [Alphaproteobacteria bacterium]
MSSANPVFCALDTPDLDTALDLARRIGPHVGGLKLGLAFFVAQGPEGVRRVAALGVPLFLDLKLHDIPNTVAGAVQSVAGLAPAFLTLHASGGGVMMAAAAEAKDRAPGLEACTLLGVSVLTSLDGADLEATGFAPDVPAQVLRLAHLARASGLGGLVCSPQELAAVRAAIPRPFTLMVPGVRPAGAASGDQKRVMPPREAILAGADRLVIGRPITQAADPAAAAARIAEEVEAALAERQANDL